MKFKEYIIKHKEDIFVCIIDNDVYIITGTYILSNLFSIEKGDVPREEESGEVFCNLYAGFSNAAEAEEILETGHTTCYEIFFRYSNTFERMIGKTPIIFRNIGYKFCLNGASNYFCKLKKMDAEDYGSICKR